MKLKDYKINDNIRTFLLIKSAEVKTDKRGRDFITLIFQDETGIIEGKIWNATADDKATFVANKVVLVDGIKELYQGKSQLRIKEIRLATKEEPSNPEIYLPKNEFDPVELKNAVFDYLNTIQTPSYREVIEHLLTKYNEEFYEYPAAKFHHHAFKHGLLYHTKRMLDLASAVTKIYPDINQDLLYAGIILHDLGKVIELSGATETYYTLNGNLTGHIALILEELVRTCIELGYDLDSGKLLLLKHVILSHHGKLEYGSPVEPHLLEAEVLNQLDNLDARMTMLETALSQTNVGEYTIPIPGLENRVFYKP